MMKRTIWVWVCVMCLAVSGARAADTAVLLEKGVYAEETKGQLDEAMGYYEQIVKDAQASRHTVAQATYRLGMCYLKKGQKDKADEVLARLVKDYAEEKDLVAKANKQLARPLEIQPAPWIDGEEMRLSIKAATGMEVGSMTYMARLIEEHGRKLWEIKETVVTMGTTQMQARVTADPETFAPAAGATKMPAMGEFEADYQPGKVLLTIKGKDKPIKKEVAVAATVYDNEQALELIRRLPLKVGYKATFPIFPEMSGQVVDCTIEVLGKEKVKAPLGEFECWKTDLKVVSGGGVGLDHTLYFSADAHRYLVKYDTGAAVMELTSAGKMAAEGAFHGYRDASLGVAIQTPADWTWIENPVPNFKKRIQFTAGSEGGVEASFIVNPLSGGPLSVRQVAEGDVAVLKQYFKAYTVREASWRERTLAGMPAAAYAADYTYDGKAKVEYRTYLLSGPTVYWFVFRVPKDRFEALRTTFDGVVEGFRLIPVEKPQ